MPTAIYALRKAAILVCAAIGLAVGVSDALAQPANLPDLTLTMSAIPNPVPPGTDYKVQIIIANTVSLLPSRPTGVSFADPSIPAPRVGGPLVSPARGRQITAGADVQYAEINLSTTVPRPRLSMTVQPPTITLRCVPSSVFGGPEVCTLGPLKKGARWTITMGYPNLGAVPFGIGYGATIDPRNLISERDELNNNDGVTVNFL